MVDVREIDGAIAEIENSELTMTRVKNLAALYVVKISVLQMRPILRRKELREPVRYYEAVSRSQGAIAAVTFTGCVKCKPYGCDERAG